MATYTNEYRTNNFPNSVMSNTNYIDVNDSIGDLINQINAYREAGQYDYASVLIKQNAATLAKVFIGSATINGLVEEIRNAQIFALKTSQHIYSDTTEPSIPNISDVWVGGA